MMIKKGGLGVLNLKININ